jgi:hypothetical protein
LENYHGAEGLPEVERDKRSEIERVMKSYTASNYDLWELIEQLFKEFKVSCDIMLLDKVFSSKIESLRIFQRRFAHHAWMNLFVNQS